jgi:hypothetical protein
MSYPVEQGSHLPFEFVFILYGFKQRNFEIDINVTSVSRQTEKAPLISMSQIKAKPDLWDLELCTMKFCYVKSQTP